MIGYKLIKLFYMFLNVLLDEFNWSIKLILSDMYQHILYADDYGVNRLNDLGIITEIWNYTHEDSVCEDSVCVTFNILRNVNVILHNLNLDNLNTGLLHTDLQNLYGLINNACYTYIFSEQSSIHPLSENNVVLDEVVRMRKILSGLLDSNNITSESNLPGTFIDTVNFCASTRVKESNARCVSDLIPPVILN